MSLRFMLPVLLALLTAPHALAQPQQGYQNCATLSKRAPADALREADMWLLKEYSPEAEHCRALALFSLKRYDEAALALENVFTRTPPEDVLLSVNLLRQAGRAWALHGDPRKAGERYTRSAGILKSVRKPTALITRLLAETLLEYGQFLATQGDPYTALQEMDQAVSLEMLGERALIARAELLLSMRQYPLAQADAEAALRLAPQNAKAQQILREIVSQTHTK